MESSERARTTVCPLYGDDSNSDEALLAELQPYKRKEGRLPSASRESVALAGSSNGCRSFEVSVLNYPQRQTYQ